MSFFRIKELTDAVSLERIRRSQTEQERNDLAARNLELQNELVACNKCLRENQVSIHRRIFKLPYDVEFNISGKAYRNT